MSVKLFALTCGHLTGDLGYLMEGGEGQAELPIPAYLIEHPKGTVLFDTGMHPDCQRDPAARLGARVTGLFSFHYRPGEEISARLQAVDRDPAKIDIIVNSHFHFDHVGGNALIPNAVMIVQKREWEAGMDPDIAAQRGERRLPQRVHDREQMFASLEKLARFEAAGTRIFFGHDSEFWKTVPQAPKAIV